MANDAFDPGPQGDYPWFPRHPSTGEPLWSDSAETDGVPVEGRTPMPRGLRSQNGVVIDMTPTRTLPDGTTVPIEPPARLIAGS